MGLDFEKFSYISGWILAISGIVSVLFKFNPFGGIILYLAGFIDMIILTTNKGILQIVSYWGGWILFIIGNILVFLSLEQLYQLINFFEMGNILIFTGIILLESVKKKYSEMNYFLCIGAYFSYFIISIIMSSTYAGSMCFLISLMFIVIIMINFYTLEAGLPRIDILILIQFFFCLWLVGYGTSIVNPIEGINPHFMNYANTIGLFEKPKTPIIIFQTVVLIGAVLAMTNIFDHEIFRRGNQIFLGLSFALIYAHVKLGGLNEEVGLESDLGGIGSAFIVGFIMTIIALVILMGVCRINPDNNPRFWGIIVSMNSLIAALAFPTNYAAIIYAILATLANVFIWDMVIKKVGTAKEFIVPGFAYLLSLMLIIFDNPPPTSLAADLKVYMVYILAALSVIMLFLGFLDSKGMKWFMVIFGNGFQIVVFLASLSLIGPIHFVLNWIIGTAANGLLTAGTERFSKVSQKHTKILGYNWLSWAIIFLVSTIIAVFIGDNEILFDFIFKLVTTLLFLAGVRVKGFIEL